MVAQQTFEVFKKTLPEYGERTVIWFPSGKNGIRVRLDNGCEFIFIYNNSDDWSFETVDCYIKKMKGGAKMR